MKMARFNGYPITLQTSLSADECHMRLVDEFYGVRRYRGWQAMSDKRLAGWQAGAGFEICLWPLHSTLSSPIAREADTSRSCRLRIRQGTDGAVISGRYSYAYGEGLLLKIVLGVIFGIIVGTMFVVAGIILAFRDVAALLLAVFGGVILAVCIWLIADSSDGGFPQESDYIVRYLARVLEAQPIEVLNPRPSASRTKY